MSRLNAIKKGDSITERIYETTNVQLFLYNAVLFNAHRIHFDYRYATEVEEYPDLVMAGPLLGDWLHQVVIDWLGDDGKLILMEYSNRKAAFVGEKLRAGGKVIELNADEGKARLELYIKNEQDEVIVPGISVVQF